MIKLELIGRSFGPAVYEFSWKDVVLYHLGIGAKAADLQLVYEKVAGGLKVFPTFAVIPIYEPLMQLVHSLDVDYTKILHGEEAIAVHKAMPPEGRLFTTCTLENIYDKGRAALVIVTTETVNEQGELLFTTMGNIFCRDEGGWNGEVGPKPARFNIPKDREPDFEVAMPTHEHQAALYRLSGDLNPLHIDPEAAQSAGFKTPILHGLCTFGLVARAAVQAVCPDDCELLKEFKARFTNAVFPGQTITTCGWQMDTDGLYHLQAHTESGVVLSQSYARFGS